jgi:hypothetical protein
MRFPFLIGALPWGFCGRVLISVLLSSLSFFHLTRDRKAVTRLRTSMYAALAPLFALTRQTKKILRCNYAISLLIDGNEITLYVTKKRMGIRFGHNNACLACFMNRLTCLREPTR